MKNIFIITGMSSLAVSTLWGIEGEPDNASAPPAVDAPAAREAAPTAALPYIGIAATAMSPALADHLGLKPGEGIIAGAVMPESPAAKAGVTVHDVITRIGDKPIGSTHELSKLVGTHKPGDTVKLGIIHKGKAKELEVQLGARPEELAMDQPDALDQLNFDGVPKHLADRVRRMIEGNLAGNKMDPGQDIIGQMPEMEDALKDMVKRMNDAMGAEMVPDEAPQNGINIRQGATLRLMDEEGSIELKSNQDSKEITVRDKGNNITWSGPWDTEQDKAAAPEDVRNRVDRLNIEDGDQGIRLKFPR